LTTAANRPFIRRFLAAVPVAQRPAFQAADGDLSQEGITRLRNAVLYRAYGDSDTLARMVESSDPGQRNVLAALVKLSPTVAQARDDAQAGRLHDLDVAADIVSATATLAKVRADKTFGSVDEYLRQGGLFGDAISPEASLILRHFDSNLRSAKAIGAFLLDYYEAVRAAGDPNQGSLFGDPPPDKATLLRQTHERHQKDRQAPAQDDLFKARGQSADRPDPAGRARSARDGGVVGGGQARPALGRGPRYLFFKAIAPGTKGRITDLFAQEVQHRGYTDTHGHYHAPHQQRHHVKGPDADAADPEPAPDPALTALLKQYAGDAEVTPAELAEAVRQYRAVEAKYRGTPGWLKAPNGQPTRLNERQWVLARTPNFKRWFGNWQFDPASPVTVVPVRGDEIPVALDDSAALRKWLLSSPDFKTATVNRSNDVPIGFSTRGLKDSLKRKGEAQRSAYAVLRSLVETAHAVDYAPSDRAEIAGQDIYVGALTLGGRLYAVRIKADVRHDRSTAYKDHKAALVEHLADIEITPAVNKGGTDGALGYPAATGPTRSGVTVSLGDLLGPDKPAASQVRDPNGEPLVVYRGQVQPPGPA
uniref:LPD3 domain-containing protein n=1 Tax=Lamprocystis purpurea TaxID=61598 RepID=UPI00058F8CDF